MTPANDQLLVGGVHFDVNVFADPDFIPVQFVRRLPAAGVHYRATPGKFLNGHFHSLRSFNSRGGN